jgi:hypothetical protein
VWKVLRDTDGERFVSNCKPAIFTGEFALLEKAFGAPAVISRLRICFMRSSIFSLENCLRYEKNAKRVKTKKFARTYAWTTRDRFWGCKKILDHYNATPSLEAKRLLKVKR